jgi:hypothetical protein
LENVSPADEPPLPEAAEFDLAQLRLELTAIRRLLES